jgi:hypothetical protein
VFRLLAGIPPIIGAIFVQELGEITAYAGVFGTVTALPFPALVFIVSRRVAAQKGISTTTHYNSFGSTEPFAATVFFCSIVALFYIFINLILR